MCKELGLICKNMELKCNPFKYLLKLCTLLETRTNPMEQTWPNSFGRACSLESQIFATSQIFWKTFPTEYIFCQIRIIKKFKNNTLNIILN